MQMISGITLEDVLREEFALAGDDPVAFLRLFAQRIRRLEDAFWSQAYLCPECGAEAQAAVLDAQVGAVYIEPSCHCRDIEDRISAAALERSRLHNLLSG